MIYIDNKYLQESVKMVQSKYGLEFEEALSMLTGNQDEILTVGFGIALRIRMSHK